MTKKTKIIIGASAGVLALSIASLAVANHVGLVELKNPIKKK